MKTMKKKKCKFCDGTGRILCCTCGGEGKIRRRYMASPKKQIKMMCTTYTEEKDCPTCYGGGTIKCPCQLKIK